MGTEAAAGAGVRNPAPAAATGAVTWCLNFSGNLYYNMGCSIVMSTEVAVPGGLSSFHCWSCRTVKAFIRFVVAALGLALLLTGGLARSQTHPSATTNVPAEVGPASLADATDS